MSSLGGALWGLAAAGAPWWGAERIRRYQAARLRALVAHCWREVPLYRERWAAAGVEPSEIRGPADLCRLPVITRGDLQGAPANAAIARSRRAERFVEHRTSGSSGMPLSIRRTVIEEWLLRALRLQVEFGQGLRPWHRRVKVLLPRGDHSMEHAWHRLGLLRHGVVDCRLPVDRIAAALLEARPDILGGYSGSLAAVAAALTTAGRRLPVRGVLCGAETMTPAMREAITAAFGRAPLTAYASHEVNLIAAECARTGLMHVAEGAVIVEVVRDGTPVKEGETGEVLVTGLHSFAAPFVRYRQGDVARRGPDRCPCGAPVMTLQEIQGRVADRFRLPDGRAIHPYELTASMLHAPWARQYQFIQERRDLIRVRVAGLGQVGEDERDRVRAALEQSCGPDVRVELEAVDEIRPEPNGKFRPYRPLDMD